VTDKSGALFVCENPVLSAPTIFVTQEQPGETPEFSDNAREPHWFALYTCANHEKRVAGQLEARGVEHFLPFYRSRRKWKDRRVFLDLPLFPGYVFARFEFPERVKVLRTRGVVRLVGSNGRPCPLAESDIETLRAGVHGALNLEPHRYLTAGRRVRVLHGPLAGMTGILVRRKNVCRVVLSVDLIARSVALEVDTADIEHIG